MAKWQSYKRFRIVDTISREYVDTIDATNGKVAMQKFRHRMMNTGIYEIRKLGNEWHMLSSYGSHFKTELVCGIGGEVVQKIEKRNGYIVVNGICGEASFVGANAKVAKELYIRMCIDDAIRHIPECLRGRI